MNVSVPENKYEMNIADLLNIENAEKYIFNEKPMIYDEANRFWIWKKGSAKWEMIDETDILINIDDIILIKDEIHKTYVRSSLFNVLKTICRKKYHTLKSLDEAFGSDMSDGYIAFKNYIYNVKTGRQIVNDDKYFIKTTIPYNLSEDLRNEGCKFDKLFEDWVGKKYKQTLYEIIGYCMIDGYPLHTLFCLYGSGRNGKSTFLKIVNKIIGVDNITSSSIERLLYNRFETIRLFGKLVCFIGEAQNKLLTTTDTIKKLTGQDLVVGEYKGGASRDFVNTAKIIVATNFVPTSVDNSEGWSSRWFIIDFPNRFSEAGDILAEFSERDWNILAMKCFEAVRIVMENKKFTNQGTIEDRMKKLEEKSIPVIPFVNEFCDLDISYEISMKDFYDGFSKYLQENKFRKMTRNAVTTMLLTYFGEVDKYKKSIKLDENKYTTAWYYTGIAWRKKNGKLPDKMIGEVIGYETLIDLLGIIDKSEDERFTIVTDLLKMGYIEYSSEDNYKINHGFLYAKY